MSLPTSETTPDGLLSLPPSRRNRKPIAYREATDSERRGFLFALTNRAKCTTEHHTWLLGSSAVLLFALIFNSPLLLVIATLTAPFLGPVMTPALSAATPSWSRFGRAMVNLLITLLVYFAVGWLAGMIPSPNGYLTLPHIHLLRSTWLEWLVVLGASALTTWFFLRSDEPSRLSSALMTYLIFFPAALAGMLYQNSMDQAWMAAALIVLARLGAALLVSLFVYWANGMVPVKLHGWLIAAATILMALVAIGAYSASKLMLTDAPNTPPMAETPIQSLSASPTALPASPTPIPSTATPIRTSAQTRTPTEAPTPAVTPVSARVIAPNGVIVRWQPDSKADVLTYLNQNGEVSLLGEQQVVGTDVWEKVMIGDGEIGWIMGRYLVTATPKP
jgi:MFS family permease